MRPAPDVPEARTPAPAAADAHGIAWGSMELPLFPLHVVLFPGRPLPLHLFEPRYRQMLRDCLDGDRRFGVVAIRSGREVGATPEVCPVGTVAEIETVEELADGRFDILTRGRERFRIRQLLNDRAYLRADVDLVREPPAELMDRARGMLLRQLLVPYLAELGAPAELLERVPRDPVALAWVAAAAAQVELPEQQRILEIDELADRLVAATRLLQREAAIKQHFGTVGSLRPSGPCGAELN